MTSSRSDLTTPKKGRFFLGVSEDLDSLNLRPIAGTDGPHFPFWSPDSRTIAFFRGTSRQRIAVAGRSLRPDCLQSVAMNPHQAA